MIDHVGFEVSDLARSAAFYDALFHPLGGRRIFESPEGIGYGINDAGQVGLRFGPAGNSGFLWQNGAVIERGVWPRSANMFPVHIGSKPLMFHANQDLDQLAGFPHLVLDTSHAAVARHDLVEVRRVFGERLRHVHLSDNAGKGWDSHLPPGEGVLDLDTFLLDLAGSDFAGVVSLEVDLRKQSQDRDALCSLLMSMREGIEATLASG